MEKMNIRSKNSAIWLYSPEKSFKIVIGQRKRKEKSNGFSKSQ